MLKELSPGKHENSIGFNELLRYLYMMIKSNQTQIFFISSKPHFLFYINLILFMLID